MGRHRVRFLLLPFVAALMLTLVACAGSGTQLNDGSLSVSDDTVDFAREFPFEWDSVFIFGPYSPERDVEASLGFDWPEYESTTIEASDSVCLVVFVKDQAVAGWYEQSRRVDLDALDNDTGFQREDAVFQVVRSEGRVYLQE